MRDVVSKEQTITLLNQTRKQHSERKHKQALAKSQRINLLVNWAIKELTHRMSAATRVNLDKFISLLFRFIYRPQLQMLH